jgi:hypothetical protein
MRWSEVRATHPEQWLVIEALAAHSADSRRIFDRIAVVEVCCDGPSTMKRCAEPHRQHPLRELCFVHTGNAELEIEERRWIGIRGTCATGSSR